MKPVEFHTRVALPMATSATQVCWVSGGTQYQEHASPHLLAVDWMGADMVAVRSPAGYAQSREMRGQYFWQRSQDYVWFESQTEKAVLRRLDYEGSTARVRSQPFVLVFPKGAIGVSWHVPDFMAQDVHGNLTVIDVRPAPLRDERAKRQFDATREVCKAIGIGYEVLDRSDDVTERTLATLCHRRHERYRPSEDVVDRLLAASRGGATFRQLCLAGNLDHPHTVAAGVLHLLWHQELHIHLDHPFSSNTTIWSPIS